MKSIIKTNSEGAILLIDNGSLSYYTSYLAFGLSKYRKIILYGSSIEDYEVTGADYKEKSNRICINWKTEYLENLLSTSFGGL